MAWLLFCSSASAGSVGEGLGKGKLKRSHPKSTQTHTDTVFFTVPLCVLASARSFPDSLSLQKTKKNPVATIKVGEEEKLAWEQLMDLPKFNLLISCLKMFL